MNNTNPNPESNSPQNISPLIQPKEAPPVSPDATAPTDSPRLLITDAQGNIVHDPSTAKYIVKPFPDGTIFRYMVNPAKAGTYLLVDSDKRPVAACGNIGVAQIICEGALLWLLRAMASAVDKKTVPSDTGKNENDKV